jgi:transcriptional coactivator HFI1/ADA1
MLARPSLNNTIATVAPNGSSVSNNNTSSHTETSINKSISRNNKITLKSNNLKMMHPHSKKRVEISKFVKKFQQKLGDEWDAYQIAVSLFIVGKLSRNELIEQIAPVLENKETKHMHNQLLMSMLANCFKREPLDGISSSIFGNSSKKRQSTNKSSQYENLKKDILSLSIRERVRIKAITKESGKKGIMQNVMVMSRQALIPKVPIVTNHLKNNNIENLKTNDVNAGPNSGTNTNLNGSPKSVTNTSNSDIGSNDNASTGNNISSNNLEMTLISVKDILDMINEPLCTESFEFPERKRLRNFMLGLIREHGLLGSVSMKSVDVLYLGLIYHMKSIITNLIDNVRINTEIDSSKFDKNEMAADTYSTAESSSCIGKKRKRITITVEDLLDSFSLTPHMIQPYGTIDYLLDTKLKNDDDYDIIYREFLTSNHQHTTYCTTNMKNTGVKITNTSNVNNTKTNDIWDEIERVITETNYNGQENYVFPNKITDISHLLKSHKTIEQEKISNPNDPVPKINLALKNKEIGTPDELAWVLNDLLGEEV